MELSKDLRLALSMGKDVWRKTNGAFDPTVGPVVELWRETRTSGSLPSDERLEAARMRVDFEAIELKGQSARITRSDVELDFGGIGKGIALDAAGRILREHELTRHLIDFDGEILVGDPPPGRTRWRIQIGQIASEPPIELDVVRQSVATSGDLHQFVVVDGIRYGHIIDPATGLGTTTGRQATVISEASAGIADALATAGCVLKPAEFKAILMRDFPGTSAVIASKEDGRTVLRMIGNPPVRASDAP
jgi:thiamine biosynthesis lipoprotein